MLAADKDREEIHFLMEEIRQTWVAIVDAKVLL
jgi:hypothetical protein